MQLYTDSDGWDGMRRDLRFTVGMLKASGVHAALAKPLTEHLGQWKSLDDEREGLDDAEVDSNAAVAWVDLKLDGATQRLSAQVLGDCGGKRDHATFQAFFAKPASELKRLGLKSQVEAMKDFPKHAEDVKLSKASGAIVKEIAAIFTESVAPLKGREDTVTEQARLARRLAQWRDEANKRRRSAKAALDEYAAANDLPRDYADAFFPAASSPSKASAKKPPKGSGGGNAPPAVG